MTPLIFLIVTYCVVIAASVITRSSTNRHYLVALSNIINVAFYAYLLNFLLTVCRACL